MKVIYFSPYSAIWVHAIPEALTAQSLQEKGHEVVYVTCDGLFDAGCMSMSIYGINSQSDKKDRKEICKICTRRKEAISTKYNLEGYSLNDFIYQKDRTDVEEIINQLPFLNFEYKIDGVKLGRAALYYIILVHKKTNLNFTNEIWNEYLVELKHTIYAYLAATRILEKENPDNVVIYNTRYPTNNAFRLAAHKKNITPYFIHAGSNIKHRLSTLQFGKDDHSQIIGTLISEWPKFKTIPNNKKNINYITEHFLALNAGDSPFVYSKPSKKKFKEITGFFDIKPTQKVCVAVLSSSDEHYAQFVFENFLPPRLDKVPFESQEEWCSALIDYFKLHPELMLIIRVHPRILPNHRDKVLSEHASVLEALFLNLPLNIKINWPKDNISLYDLANITDLFLNSWSSVGKEMCLLGIPVLSYGHSWLLYPFDLNYIGETRESYFTQLQLALTKGWDFELARKAFRWYVLEQVYSVIDLSESFTFDETYEKNIVKRVVNKIRRIINLDYIFFSALKKKNLNTITSKKIETILLHKYDTPLNLFEPEVENESNIKKENIYIKNALQVMIKSIGGYHRFSEGKLSKNFDAFIKQIN